MKRFIVTGVMLMVLLGITSLVSAIRASTTPNVWIYVDNASTDAMTVTIDGEEVERIPAGKAKVVKCFAGERRIVVKRDGKTVFDEIKMLEEPFGSRPTKYLLNPEKGNRYWRHQVQYGVAVPKVVRSYGYGLDSKYHALANAVHLVDAQAWMQVRADYILDEKPPRTMQSRVGMESVSVLARMPKSYFDRIKAARTRFDVSQAEYDSFSTFIKQLLRSTKPM